MHETKVVISVQGCVRTEVDAYEEPDKNESSSSYHHCMIIEVLHGILTILVSVQILNCPNFRMIYSTLNIYPTVLITVGQIIYPEGITKY